MWNILSLHYFFLSASPCSHWGRSMNESLLLLLLLIPQGESNCWSTEKKKHSRYILIVQSSSSSNNPLVLVSYRATVSNVRLNSRTYSTLVFIGSVPVLSKQGEQWSFNHLMFTIFTLNQMMQETLADSNNAKFGFEMSVKKLWKLQLPWGGSKCRYV